MPTYRIHDLVVRSSILLSADECDAAGAPDVEVVHAGVRQVSGDPPDGEILAVELAPPLSFYIAAGGGEFVVRYGEACELRVAADGARVDVTVDPREGDAFAGIVLSAGGLAFAAMRRGHTLYHASGAALRGRGVIALGDPGAGKTTLAAELALAGATVLADDAIRVAVDADGATVFPAARVLRLRPEAAERLGAVPPERSADGRVVLLPTGPAPERVPLAAAFVTEVDAGLDHLSFARLNARDALIEAVRHARIAGWVDGRQLVDHFATSGRLVDTVPFFRLRRPPHPLPPAEVRAAVEAVLSG